MKRHLRQAWLAGAVLWSLILVVGNSHGLPTLSNISDCDGYLELDATSQDTFRMSSRAPNPGARRFFLPCASMPLGHDRPEYTYEGQTTRVGNTYLTFRRDISANHAHVIAQDFQAGLLRVLAREQWKFVLQGIAWWFVSVAELYGLGWIWVVAPHKMRIANWHPGQLVLLWAGATGLLLASGLLSEGVTYFDAVKVLIELPTSSPYATKFTLIDFLGSLLARTIVVFVYFCMPVALIVVTWTWFGLRQRGSS